MTWAYSEDSGRLLAEIVVLVDSWPKSRLPGSPRFSPVLPGSPRLSPTNPCVYRHFPRLSPANPGCPRLSPAKSSAPRRNRPPSVGRIQTVRKSAKLCYLCVFTMGHCFLRKNRKHRPTRHHLRFSEGVSEFVIGVCTLVCKMYETMSLCIVGCSLCKNFLTNGAFELLVACCTNSKTKLSV